MNEMVLYKQVFVKYTPKVKEDLAKFANVAVKTQALIRGFLARKRVERMHKEHQDSQMRNLKEQVQTLNGKKGKKDTEPAAKEKEKPKAKMTKED